MDEKTYKALMAELEEHKLHLAHLLDEKRKLECDLEDLTVQRDTLLQNNEELLRELARSEGRTEAYAHCIDAMNGITHEKKVGFRHADG